MMTEPKDRFINRDEQPEDHEDRSLRPAFLDDMIGQQQVKENLRILIEAAKLRT
ncbi:MAG: Holliday junction branch migration DNA helicase RuvB, partial [Anaerolineaceae bacterium]|nr:Holliday junction branch migration DNA helicase RuvB [Anaerolineaceae bacterium]